MSTPCYYCEVRDCKRCIHDSDGYDNVTKWEETATQMREYRNAALEEAAKVCESLWGDGDLNDVAQEIRALKEQK